MLDVNKLRLNELNTTAINLLPCIVAIYVTRAVERANGKLLSHISAVIQAGHSYSPLIMSIEVVISGWRCPWLGHCAMLITDRWVDVSYCCIMYYSNNNNMSPPVIQRLKSALLSQTKRLNFIAVHTNSSSSCILHLVMRQIGPSSHRIDGAWCRDAA